MADVRDYATKLAKLPDRIAAIVGKTHGYLGELKFDADNPQHFLDDEALAAIRDLLDEIDQTLIERNKNKRLPAHR